MRGFTEIAGRVTRLVYSRERGSFVSEAVPHPFEANEASPATPTRHDASAPCPELHETLCPITGGTNVR